MRSNRKTRVVDITNYKNATNFECNKCNYACRGKNGMKLHIKYTHGVEKESIVIEQFCVRCKKIFTGSVSRHMIQHREEI